MVQAIVRQQDQLVGAIIKKKKEAKDTKKKKKTLSITNKKKKKETSIGNKDSVVGNKDGLVSNRESCIVLQNRNSCKKDCKKVRLQTEYTTNDQNVLISVQQKPIYLK